MMNAFFYFFIIIIGVLAGILTYTLFVRPFKAELEEEHFISKVQKRSLGAEKGKTSFLDKIGTAISKIAPTSRAKSLSIQESLDVAGIKMTAGSWQGMKIFITLAAAVFALLIAIFINRGIFVLIIVTIIGGIVGWSCVNFYLYSKSKKRRNEIQRLLPDALERLSNMTLSGLTLDEALQELSTADDLGAIGEEFARVSREVNYVNVPREEALSSMAKRCQIVDVTFFVSSMIQAMQDGSSVSNALQQQAVNARAAWFDRLKEEINKLDTKITIPLGLCFMPATMIILVAPVAYQAVSSFITMF